MDAAVNKGIDVSKEDLDYGMQFAEDGTPADGETAAQINIVFNLYGYKKTTQMKYDADLGKYVFWQYGKEMIDESTEQKEAFENVIVILAESWNEGVYHVANLYGIGIGEKTKMDALDQYEFSTVVRDYLENGREATA